jgi:catechol 2,3-dioxygenase-like lactoylglutathione lyase family enzyme
LLAAYDQSVMSGHNAAVLYAKDLARVSAFYEALLGLDVVHAEADHVILESSTYQLVVVAIPDDIARDIEISTPPELRTETPIKLAFTVASIEDSRARAATLGGGIGTSAWEWAGHLVCDGYDPEGNVVQFRERLS